MEFLILLGLDTIYPGLVISALAHLIAVSAPVVGVVLAPVCVAPGGAVAPLEGVLGPDVVGPDPGVLSLPRGGVDQGVLLGRGDGHKLPRVRAGAGQAGSLPRGLGNKDLTTRPSTV